jgi:hypothetical protein
MKGCLPDQNDARARDDLSIVVSTPVQEASEMTLKVCLPTVGGIAASMSSAAGGPPEGG